MNTGDALTTLGALAQHTRLDVFRLLVRAGRDGLYAGQIAEELDVRQNTLSSNLALLTEAGLITRDREGRSIRYRAQIAQMNALISFLTKDCCAGLVKPSQTERSPSETCEIAPLLCPEHKGQKE